MTARAQAQCGACVHYRSFLTTGLAGPSCAAFPDAIPAPIWENKVDHRQPVDGDHGIQWESKDGAPYPTYALREGQGDTGDMSLLNAPMTASSMTAAAGAITGAMVALVPSDEDAARLAVEGGEAAGDLHCTLVYLGDANRIDQSQRDKLLLWARDMAEGGGAVLAEAFGVAVFNPTGDEPCAVLVLSGAELAEFQEIAAADALDMVPGAPDQHKPWCAHLALIYAEQGQPLGVEDFTTDRTGPITFDRLRLAFAGEVTDIPLGEPAEPADEPIDEPAAEAEQVEAAIPADTEPDTATVASAERVAWEGCLRCYGPMHDGACPPRL